MIGIEIDLFGRGIRKNSSSANRLRAAQALDRVVAARACLTRELADRFLDA